MKTNKTKSAMTALVIAAMLCTAAMPVKAADSQWVKTDGTWSYVKEDGSKATGWIKDGGCWYAFDADGAMRTGWIASNEHWYFMGESGVMQSDAWVEDNGAKYYIKGTGVMAKDYVKDGYELTSDGKAIPLGESGSVVVTDPAELEGKVIEGNLYVDVTTAKELELKGVTVKGKLVVLGDNKTAGKVTLTDSKVETINTQSRNAEVVLSGKTEVKNVVIEETAKVTPDKNYKGEVENIEVQSTTKGEVVIDVPADNVSTRTYATVDVQAPVGNLEVKTDTQVKVNADVKNVIVTETAKDTTVEVSKGNTVGTITADAPVKIDGKGTVEKVEANVDGVEAGKDTTIKDVETGKDVTDAPDVTKPDKGGSSSGGSSSGGSGGGTETRPIEELKIVEDAKTKEHMIQFKALEASTGVTAYEYTVLLEDQTPINLYVSLDKINNIYESLEDLVADFKQDEKINKIIVKAYKDKEVIASSALDINLNVTVKNSDDSFVVSKSNIDEEDEFLQYSISADIFKKLEFGKDTVTLLWLPISESEQDGHYTWYRIVDQDDIEDVKQNNILWNDKDVKEEVKFAINIIRGEYKQEDNSYTINITYLNNGKFVSASDKAPTKAKITIEGMAEGEDKTFKPITLLNENEYGKITDNFVPTNYKDNLMRIGLNLLQGENKKVRVSVNLNDVPNINTGNVQFIAIDSEGIAWNIAKSGWGPAEGFSIPEEIVYTEVYIVGESGTYDGEILVEDSVDKTVYASERFAFTISEE